MATNYKILGQGVNSLKIDAPANGSTIISELKIKNTSYPTNVDVMCSNEFSSIAELDSFNPNADFGVFSTVPQPDGKIIIGGNFAIIDGVTRNRIARLNGNGTLDTGFNPNANSDVRSIALQPDGKIIIGGDFTTLDGVTRNRIARLNSDGTLDADFNPNANNPVRSIALQPDGKIIIGGDFTTLDGVTRNRIARLNGNGTLDTGFNPNANAFINSIALQSDGKILIGGRLSTIGGVTRLYIARLNSDGALDTGFNANMGGAEQGVASIALQPDGKIIIGGDFDTINGLNRNRIARLDSDGSLDLVFNPSLGTQSSTTYSIALQPDGKIIIGGNFTTISGVDKFRFARLNGDGILDTGFGFNANSDVRSIALQPDGKILIGGNFTTIDGVTRNRIARIFEYTTSENKNYIIKNKSLSYDEEIKISGGIALESGESLVIDTRNYSPDTVVIQAYGIEETS
jgi:uncharacterized delta-60 repeat protein